MITITKPGSVPTVTIKEIKLSGTCFACDGEIECSSTDAQEKIVLDKKGFVLFKQWYIMCPTDKCGAIIYLKPE